jgi:hypothetical protein
MERLERFGRAGMAAILALLATVQIAWPQTTSPVPPALPVPSSPPYESSGTYGLLAFALVVGMLVVVGTGVKLYDLKRKREDEGVALQSRLSDLIFTEPSVAGLPLTPSVHVPLARRSPVVITLTGSVPSPALREVIIERVDREAASVRRNHRIEDRIIVAPLMWRHAA